MFKIRRPPTKAPLSTPPRVSATPPSTSDPPREKPAKVSLPVVGQASMEDADKVVEEATPPPGFDPRYPPLSCSICNIGISCPKYSEGYECFFAERFAEVPARTVEELDQALYEVFKDTVERYRFARLQERFGAGGFVSPEVTRLGETVMNQAERIKTVRGVTNRLSVEIKAEGSGPRAGGMLASIFGFGGKPRSEDLELNPPAETLVGEGEIVGEAEPSRVGVTVKATKE